MDREKWKLGRAFVLYAIQIWLLILVACKDAIEYECKGIRHRVSGVTLIENKRRTKDHNRAIREWIELHYLYNLVVGIGEW